MWYRRIFFAYGGVESWCHKGTLIVSNIKCLDYLLPLINPSKAKNLYLVCLSLGQHRKQKRSLSFTLFIKGLILNFSRNILRSFKNKVIMWCMQNNLRGGSHVPSPSGDLNADLLQTKFIPSKFVLHLVDWFFTHYYIDFTTEVLINESGSPCPLYYYKGSHFVIWTIKCSRGK